MNMHSTHPAAKQWFCRVQLFLIAKGKFLITIVIIFKLNELFMKISSFVFSFNL